MKSRVVPLSKESTEGGNTANTVVAASGFVGKPAKARRSRNVTLSTALEAYRSSMGVRIIIASVCFAAISFAAVALTYEDFDLTGDFKKQLVGYARCGACKWVICVNEAIVGAGGQCLRCTHMSCAAVPALLKGLSADPRGSAKQYGPSTAHVHILTLHRKLYHACALLFGQAQQYNTLLAPSLQNHGRTFANLLQTLNLLPA